MIIKKYNLNIKMIYQKYSFVSIAKLKEQYSMNGT